MHVFRIPVGAKSTGKRKLPDTYPQINIKTLRDINHKFETSNFKTSLPDGTQPKTEQRSQASLAEHATLQRKNKKSKVKQTREQVLTCGAFLKWKRFPNNSRIYTYPPIKNLWTIPEQVYSKGPHNDDERYPRKFAPAELHSHLYTVRPIKMGKCRINLKAISNETLYVIHPDVSYSHFSLRTMVHRSSLRPAFSSHPASPDSKMEKGKLSCSSL